MKNPNGKPVGLMVEGSTAYMSALEASKGLMNNPDIKEGGDIIDKTAQKDSAPTTLKHEGMSMKHDGVPMKHDGVPMKHDGVPMKDYKGMSMKYDSPVPLHGPLHEGHEESPATFTAMSGGSSLYQTHLGGVDPKTGSKKKQNKKTKADSKREYIDKKLNELQKTNPNMSPKEMLEYAQNSYRALPLSLIHI